MTRATRPEPAPMIFGATYTATPKMAATRRVMLVGRRYRRLLDQALREAGYSQVRWEILHAIAMEGESTLMEIASRIGLEAPSIVGTMEKLDSGGYLERHANGADRRSRIIRLTNKGKEAVEIMTGIVAREREKLWAGVAPADIDTMLSVLNRMRDNLWEGERPAR
ncbi:MarR family winged helix-turn-helix transcriptional regulator [Sphingomonas baiyangensis]|uniref:MarR family transcriptional regulator n=1 Tax=Sphingomonas baiyangensis TaxID=2572576 RepID=A0A4U1L171_9SPHN|nr:MarR family transcriptional regulator [Sphingomonas baiyangensis]TKD49880.1 MarR family transcriptional regulator [Sphingomonas baiyangensis]